MPVVWILVFTPKVLNAFKQGDLLFSVKLEVTICTDIYQFFDHDLKI